jgi:peptidoglycan/LPS O-acetylase OafA/YrhL
VPPLTDLVTFYQPTHWWPLLATGILLAIGFAVRRHQYRPALLVGAAAGLLLLGQTALVGANDRYLHPIEPLFAVLASGGLLAAGRLLSRRAVPDGRRRYEELQSSG